MTDISHEQAKGAATRLIAGAFRRDGERLDFDKRPQFSIPCRPDRDDDTVIIAYIEQQAALIASQAARIGELEEGLGAIVSDWDNNTHRRERYVPSDPVTQDATGVEGYWSPSAAMIHSEHIARARSLLSRKGGE